MKQKITREYLDTIKDTHHISTPYFEGFVKHYIVDDQLSLEQQDILVKKDLIYEDALEGNHLEFNFPMEGNAEVEINKKYFHSKAPVDLFSFVAFEKKSFALFIPTGQRIRQLSINLNADIHFKQTNFPQNIISGDNNLFKVSGHNDFVRDLVKKLYDAQPEDFIEKSEIRFWVYELMEFSSNKLLSNLTYHRCMSKGDLEIIREVRNYIDQNFLENQSLTKIGKQFGINDFKMKKTYKEVYGETIFETIRKKRMDYAMEMIASKKYTLNQIAYRCGYDNYPGFYKTFKKYFSYSPSHLI